MYNLGSAKYAKLELKEECGRLRREMRRRSVLSAVDAGKRGLRQLDGSGVDHRGVRNVRQLPDQLSGQEEHLE